MASVSFSTISRFCESENTPSMSLTLTNGINFLLWIFITGFHSSYQRKIHPHNHHTAS
jgi:hypothetical protein